MILVLDKDTAIHTNQFQMDQDSLNFTSPDKGIQTIIRNQDGTWSLDSQTYKTLEILP